MKYRSDVRGFSLVETMVASGIAAAIALGAADGIWAVAGDTDGVDGLDEVAGALITPTTLSRARALGHDRTLSTAIAVRWRIAVTTSDIPGGLGFLRELTEVAAHAPAAALLQLELSRVESKGFKLALTPLDLSAETRRALELTALAAERRGQVGERDAGA